MFLQMKISGDVLSGGDRYCLRESHSLRLAQIRKGRENTSMLDKILGFSCHWLPLIFCMLVGCGGTSKSSVPVPPSEPFTNPQRVKILGYNDHAMEPFLSRDGNYLFFNNSNDSAVNTNLHWATRIDDLTFQYQGEMAGLNTLALEAVASMDRDNMFYFISNRSYAQTGSTIYLGTFANGTVSNVAIVPGISATGLGIVDFDAEIGADGNTHYFAEGLYDSTGVLQTADILIAEKNATSFVRSANSTAIMRQINSSALEYAPATSASGLEIFFTRLEGNSPAIYGATRANVAEPFGTPTKIQAIAGFVEAPTISPDNKSLYYHRLENGRFVIYRVSRP